MVIDYKDEASGLMEESADGGRFTSVTLHPVVTITDASKIDGANELHEMAIIVSPRTRSICRWSMNRFCKEHNGLNSFLLKS